MAREQEEKQATAAATARAGAAAAAAADDDQERPPVVVPEKNYGFPREAFDPSLLPDFDVNFLSAEDREAFVQALSAPDPAHSTEDVSTIRLGSPVPGSAGLGRSSFDNSLTRRQSSAAPELGAGDDKEDPQEVAAHAAAAAADVSGPTLANGNSIRGNGSGSGSGSGQQRNSLFITAQHDWAPVHERIPRSGTSGGGSGGGAAGTKGNAKRRHKRPRTARPGRRTKDETREGYLYGLLKWPFLLFVSGWVLGLAIAYVLTRYYIWFYEYFISWRGTREKLRRNMRATSSYREWRAAARELDEYLGNSAWRETNEFAYYDWKTVRRVWDSLKKSREKAQAVESRIAEGKAVESDERVDGEKAVEALRALLAACVKNNFVGVENPRLYSQTYYGTKNLVQNHVDEVEKSLKFILDTKQMRLEDKRELFTSLHGNYGRTALCLSGGATFAYYHFGVVKALLEEDLLPDVITGTSGGALVAGLVATRTNEELKQLLVPALASKITACAEPFTTWFRRWYRTGARFDSVNWARDCSWWTHGSMTFREAYERTGRILNVSCVPADPHSPTMLCNYLTSPDCVVWSAVIASAAVPGILNPVVLMMKQRDGSLVPYSFGHKWKDGSLRTDIPIKALNMHFNVNFTIVSQVNPHINLFFFSSRGSVGHPVTHRRGRGWRGGFLGSAAEQYIKLDLTKWLKILRQLELLPRPMGQDWSQVWLQGGFGGTITIWPRSIATDFLHILTDPTPARLARMIHEGQQSAFPTLKFVANRLKVERLVEMGRRQTRGLEIVTGGGGSGTSASRGRDSIVTDEELRMFLRGRSGAGGKSSGAESGSGAVADVLGGSSVTATSDEGEGTTADEMDVSFEESAVVDDDDEQFGYTSPGASGGEEVLESVEGTGDGNGEQDALLERG
ncbi:triacylglycerol lipase [Diaporthe helianthi]|uniref:Triacylglycerol lipase n=1 Tax=Diaporthe helianthi TaxID=158607 RepID=A0A2P5I2F4_DIAHE|nr:triacylglycerol lipase [Diaporthe helianthi]